MECDGSERYLPLLGVVRDSGINYFPSIIDVCQWVSSMFTLGVSAASKTTKTM